MTIKTEAKKLEKEIQKVRKKFKGDIPRQAKEVDKAFRKIKKQGNNPVKCVDSKKPRFRFRKVAKGKQRLAFCDNKVVETKTFKNPKGVKLESFSKRQLKSKIKRGKLVLKKNAVIEKRLKTDLKFNSEVKRFALLKLRMLQKALQIKR